jgi:glucose-6-phosphate 1-dehydrogenase
MLLGQQGFHKGQNPPGRRPPLSASGGLFGASSDLAKRKLVPGGTQSGRGLGAQRPNHLTFDLADASKMSLSFCGKRPGPGMRLDKLSLQFAMRGDRTLFTTADVIERLWQVSTQLPEAPPPVRLYELGSWGPKSIHQLIAPHAWSMRLQKTWCIWKWATARRVMKARTPTMISRP